MSQSIRLILTRPIRALGRRRLIIPVVCLALGLALSVGLAAAQRRQRKAPANGPVVTENGIPKTDPNLSGRFTFVRLRFDTSQYGYLYNFNTNLGDGGPPWSHDYPMASRHLMKIMGELSKIDANLDLNEPILTFDDPLLFKFPFAYLCEIGVMTLSDAEIAGWREYLLRGGFLMIDDFRHPSQFANLQVHVRRAFPEYELKRLDLAHPVFNCFFSIGTLDLNPVYGPYYKPEFWGLEDSSGRLMMIVNYNYDVSDYWQFSDNPFRPIEETNEAYKFGVNYIMYALTH